MDIDKARLQELAHKWMNGNITGEEKQEFISWYNRQDDSMPIEVPPSSATDETEHAIKMFSKIYSNIHSRTGDMEEERSAPRSVFMFSPFLKYAAAILLLISAAFYYLQTKNIPSAPIVNTVLPPQQNEVVAPSSVHAVIRLADGRNIALDSMKSGVVMTQGNIKLSKLPEGEIVYRGSGNDITYNTLINPRGSRVVHLVLADGTNVWLNSESSVKYPTSFPGSNREVEVTGESYFEVAKDSLKPFIVKKNDVEVAVLGTHFNVNAYDDEENQKVTLLEGSIKLSSNSARPVQLQPGEQGRLNDHGNISISRHVDLEKVMAWKNGKFQFDEKTDIQTIMREISRWYNVDVSFKETVTGFFGGSISRNANLSGVLKILESTGKVHFVVSGNVVTVKR